jgi:hypothetical protein
MLKVQISFSVFLILYAFSENTLKLFYRRPRIRQKYLIVFGLRQKSLSAHGDYGDFTVVLFKQSRLQVRQKHFSVHREKA